MDLIWEGICLCVGMLGLVIRCLVIGYVPKNTSGRNTHKQIAETLFCISTICYIIVRFLAKCTNFLYLQEEVRVESKIICRYFVIFQWNVFFVLFFEIRLKAF
jgi:hypothetical protein